MVRKASIQSLKGYINMNNKCSPDLLTNISYPFVEREGIYILK